ncbi:hypothetical protein EVAR_16664_1 [Eumeta japonica]|uniref:Uncharacterized protein n=1 Tax=Eumeta variegata TaxID=151549 RepID=A0A4C1V076_EUMVA|nr:hypothetical protein EVAR_16664_1 [Eumeta japonica]
MYCVRAENAGVLGARPVTPPAPLRLVRLDRSCQIVDDNRCRCRAAVGSANEVTPDTSFDSATGHDSQLTEAVVNTSSAKITLGLRCPGLD